MASTFSRCLICDSPADANHFGATSCRACAAFFRRKVAANQKMERRCGGGCKLDTIVKRRLCVSCRFEKCLKSGMKKSAVLTRFSKKTTSEEENVPTTSKGPSILQKLQEGYGKLQKARKTSFRIEDDHTPKMCGYKELNEIIEQDIKLIFENFATVFFQMQRDLEEEERKKLLTQFIGPFLFLDCAFRSIKSEMYVLPNGDYADSNDLEKYYSDPGVENDESAKLAKAFFEPYWKQNDQTLRKQVKYIKMDTTEFLFLSALLFWDYGIDAQTDECIASCTKMRTKIIEELNEYEKLARKGEDHCVRVGEIVILLQAVQRSLDRFYDSEYVSILYNVYEKHCRFFELIRIQ